MPTPLGCSTWLRAVLVACAAALLMLGAPAAHAQRITDARLAVAGHRRGEVLRAAVPTFDAHAAAPRADSRVSRVPEEVIIFMATGAAVGIIVGAGYGVVEAVKCESCIPGLQLFMVLGYSVAGIPYGAAAGLVTYAVVWPIRYAWRRL